MDINQIVSTILLQVGKGTLNAVGARKYRTAIDDGNHGVAFEVGRGGKHCQITLNEGADMYVVKFFTANRRGVKFGETFDDVFCDQLSEMVWQSHLDKNKAA